MTEEIPLYVAVGEEPLYDSTDSANRTKLSKVEKTANSNIVVKKGDTLIGIAIQTKPADISLERMLVALYRANTGAFVGKNMNRLKRGQIIRLPDTAELEAVKQREAAKEFHAQASHSGCSAKSIRQGLRTGDIYEAGMQKVGCSKMGDAVVAAL